MLAADSSIAGYIGRWRPSSVPPEAAAFARQVVRRILCRSLSSEDEPSLTGDERWDTLLAALAEHLAAGHDAAPPQWAELRVLRRPWFPAELEIQRAEALVWAPAAFRKHGV